eukprot:scaffold243919_cov26-Tisochrysis_lutea.AAC.3
MAMLIIVAQRECVAASGATNSISKPDCRQRTARPEPRFQPGGSSSAVDSGIEPRGALNFASRSLG